MSEIDEARERERFEAAWRGRAAALHRDVGGEYSWPTTRDRWMYWLAGGLTWTPS